MHSVEPGELIGDRYEVEKMLGQGGMATVYRVRHKELGSRHALKLLDIAASSIRKRLLQEGRIQASLAHPHIVAVTDVLDIEGSPGLLMEYVDGPAMDEWLAKYKPTVEEAVVVFRAIVAGVGQAHARGESVLKYARYGSEVDVVMVDNVKLGEFGATENEWIVARFVLPALAAGVHDLSVTIVDGIGTAHFIDMLRLTSAL